jgi:NDP-sugar pyrophosphorylase family protein
MMRPLVAAILAGGRGSRLRSCVNDRPKALAPIGGRPFLSYLLDHIAAAGIPDVVLCTGYLGDQIERAFGDSYHGLRLAYSQEPSPCGTGGALRLAAAKIESDPVLVFNGDSFFDIDLVALWRWHHGREAHATIALTRVVDAARYGLIEVDDQGAVVAFHEKSSVPSAGWINAGTYVLTHRLLQAIPQHRAVSLETELFPSWIGQGLYGCRLTGRFIDIGTPSEYAAAEPFFSGHVGDRCHTA